MSAFNFQQPVEQLYAFMDGELDPAFEQQLFNELAQNQELRVEMKDLMTMRQAVQHDISLPSPFVKDRLLTAVGFSGSAAVTAARWQSFQRLAATFVKPLMGVILGAGLTAIILMSHYENNTNTVNYAVTSRADMPEWTLNVPLSEQETLKSERSILHNQRTPKAVSDNSRNISNNTTIVIYPDIDQQPSENESIVTSFTDNEIPSTTPSQVYTPEPTSSASTPELTPPATIVVTKPIHSDKVKLNTPTVAEDDNYDHGLSIRIRGLYNYSYPKSTIAGKENSWVNNAAFGAVYHFNKDISAGVEIGVERFAQVFSGAEGAAEVWYEQNPQMLWAGVLTQYNIWQLESTTNFHVYGETFAGAAGTLGLLGRQTFGLNISPVPAVTFSVGAEAAVSPYIFKGKWFSTEKVGLTFGLSFTPEGIR